VSKARPFKSYSLRLENYGLGRSIGHLWSVGAEFSRHDFQQATRWILILERHGTGEGCGTIHPSFVKVGVAHLLREGSLSLEVVLDGIRHERLDTTGSGERHIRTYRRKRRKTPLRWEELSPQMAGSRDTGRQWEGNMMLRFG